MCWGGGLKKLLFVGNASQQMVTWKEFTSNLAGLSQRNHAGNDTSAQMVLLFGQTHAAAQIYSVTVNSSSMVKQKI